MDGARTRGREDRDQVQDRKRKRKRKTKFEILVSCWCLEPRTSRRSDESKGIPNARERCFRERRQGPLKLWSKLELRLKPKLNL